MAAPEEALAALLRRDWAALAASPLLAAAAAALVAATLLLAFLLWRLLSRSRGRDAVLLLGPCGAGKTALFSLLRDGGTFAGSVTSMAENAATLRVAAAPGGRSREIRLVDLPGHPRLRGRLDAFAPAARALVFVVDGRDGVFIPGCRATAELLLDVLEHPALRRRLPPLLLAVNKTDRGVGCHSVEFVRKRLEREIDALRSARGTLADAGGSSAAALASGGRAAAAVAAAPFTFASAGVRLTVAGISVLKDDVGAVRAFAATA